MSVDDNAAKEFDALLASIADYALHPPEFSEEARKTARLALADTLGCGVLALSFEDCRARLGPLVPGATLSKGARVIGLPGEFDPMEATFQWGVMNRWLDYNDTWLAAEWGHPSDNLAALLALGDYLNRVEGAEIAMSQLLDYLIQAYEIQGVLALSNSFNQVGIDHVVLVKLASTAMAAVMLGADRAQLLASLSLAFVDGQSLRTYRHAPNTGWRKSWAAGDAASRGVRLAWMATRRHEMGYPSVLSVPKWGFEEVVMKGLPLTLSQPFGDYVMRHILFKIAYPAEFHAQTAVEAALQLSSAYGDRLSEITRIEIKTHEAAVRIISKTGPLHNPADRDHCLQYMVASALCRGKLEASDYLDEAASDPRIDALRDKMVVQEVPAYTRAYFSASERAIPNALRLYFADGSKSEEVEVYYPIGHARRREEGVPLLWEKCVNNLTTFYSKDKAHALQACCQDEEKMGLPVDIWLEPWLEIAL